MRKRRGFEPGILDSTNSIMIRGVPTEPENDQTSLSDLN